MEPQLCSGISLGDLYDCQSTKPSNDTPVETSLSTSTESSPKDTTSDKNTARRFLKVGNLVYCFEALPVVHLK